VKTKTNDRRSQRTRESLFHALLTLMREKRYDSITVQDIIDRANVGRSTFYAHFVDKEDLAVSSFEQVLDSLIQSPVPGASDEHRLISTVALLRHVQEQQPIFQTLVRGRGLELFFERGQAYWSKKIEQDLRALMPAGETPAVPLPIVSAYVTGAFMTLLKWWLDNKMSLSPERLDEIFQQLVLPGVRAALGEG
jgi:AcrR family transcriptional regulator